MMGFLDGTFGVGESKMLSVNFMSGSVVKVSISSV